MTGPLEGLRVIDCSEGLAGPMAAMYLADFGADVVKVEPPGGERGRSLPGFPTWNRNKRGLTLDLQTAEGRLQLRDLVRGAGVCIFSQPLGELEAAGLDPLSVQALNGGAIYLHMPALTRHGPWSAMPESAELLCAALGVSRGQYAWDDVPVDPVIPHVLYAQAIWGATAAVAALVERERTGYGQTVTVGGLQGFLVAMTGGITHRPEIPAVRSPGGGRGANPVYRLYQCADGGWMFLAGLTPAFFTAALGALGILDEIVIDPRLDGELLAIVLPENAPWVMEKLDRAFQAKGRDEWIRIIREAGCPCGPVLDRETWFDHEQVRSIGMHVEVDDAERGTVEMPGIPLNLVETPATIRASAPAPGEHNDGVEPGAPTPALEREPPLAAGPLAGFRVLDLGSIIAGTYAGSLLAELGADVIKVEPLGGDSLRNFAPTFAGFNLGKRSLALDLQSEIGRDVFYRMVRAADVVVDNYRPGVLQRLRVDYASLAEVNARIITVSVTGFGEGGPMRADPGFDPLLQAASGMMHAQGGDDAPVFFTLPVNDVASAATAALGAVLSLYHRERSGQGQRVWTSLCAQSIMMQSGEVTRFSGRPPAKIGGRDFPGPSPLDRFYKTADGWLRLQATSPEHVSALRRAGLLPPESGESEQEIERMLSATFGQLDTERALVRLAAAEVPAAPGRQIRSLMTDPRLAGEGAFNLLTLAGGIRVWTASRYARFSRTQNTAEKGIPGLGEHTRQVLAEFGYSPAEIDAMVAKRIVAEGAPFDIVAGASAG